MYELSVAHAWSGNCVWHLFITLGWKPVTTQGLTSSYACWSPKYTTLSYNRGLSHVNPLSVRTQFRDHTCAEQEGSTSCSFSTYAELLIGKDSETAVMFWKYVGRHRFTSMLKEPLKADILLTGKCTLLLTTRRKRSLEVQWNFLSTSHRREKKKTRKKRKKTCTCILHLPLSMSLTFLGYSRRHTETGSNIMSKE